MRKMLMLTGYVIILILFTGTVRADLSVGVSLDKDGLNSFYLAIGEHYQSSEKEIKAVSNLNVSDEELPLVFFFAKSMGVGKDDVVRLRLKGKSWMEICLHFGHSAELFYVPIKSNPGPPFGKAYGHFKNKDKKNWKEIRLTDAEIVNFVNLKFMSEHYGYSPDEIIKMRAKGKSFVAINGDVKKIKGKGNSKDKSLAQKNMKKSKGKKKK